MSLQDQAVTIEPNGTHRATVLWLHGLGADGNDFVPIVSELKIPSGTGIKFIFPQAPKRSITINRGMVMRGWYDVRAMDLTEEEDSEGINESAALLGELLDSESSLIASDRIILAGFSQGGAMVLHSGLRYLKPLAGLLALSTYLPLMDQFDNRACSANQGTPILMMHGTLDPVIPVSTADRSRRFLQSKGYRLDWQQYMMQHAVCAEQILYISGWMQKVLGRSSIP